MQALVIEFLQQRPALFDALVPQFLRIGGKLARNLFGPFPVDGILGAGQFLVPDPQFFQSTLPTLFGVDAE